MDAGVAQQAEQLIRNQQVTSSNLVAGSRRFIKLNYHIIFVVSNEDENTYLQLS